MSTKLNIGNTDITTIKDEDVLRRLWHEAQDFGRKREIRAHMYKLREERLKELYQQVEVPVTPTRAELIMEQQNTASKFGLGSKAAVTGGHGDSLPDQSFESFKTKEIRDSESPTRFGTVIPSDNSGWHIKTSEEVSADGKTHTQRTSATTEGTKEIDGGRTSFAGKNEEARSERFEGDEKNFVHSKGDQSATFLAENTVIEGDDGCKIQKKSTSISSSSSKVIRSQQVIGDDTDFAKPQLESGSATTSVQETKSSHTTTTSSSTQQEQTTSEVQSLETDGNIASKPLSKDPERVAKAFRLIALPGTIITENVTVINPSTKMITTVKRLEDGTEVTTRTYEKIGEQPTMVLENLTKELRNNKELMREYEEVQKAETRASKKDVADKITNLQFIAEERSDTARVEQVKKQQQHEVITTSTTKITSDLDATHDSFARSLRCVSPSESVRSVRSNSTTGRSSVSPDKSVRGRRSPSRESDTSRFSTHTTTRSSRTDISTTHKDYMRPTITSERKQSNFKEETVQESTVTEAYDTVDKTKLKERSERLERSVSPKKVPQNTPDATPRGPSPDKMSSRPVSKTPKESSPFCSVNSSRDASPIKRDSSPTKITSAKLVRENSSETFNVDTTITVSTKDKLQQRTREDVEVFNTESQLTDLDDITINVKLENVTDDIEVTTTVEEVDVSDKTSTAAKKTPKEKPPLVRSETFEERCRKILGMSGNVEQPEKDKEEKETTSIFSTYDNTLTRSSEIREKRKKIEQEIKTIESETMRAARKTNEFIESERKPSSPAKASSPVRKHSQPSPERRSQPQSKEQSPVRKYSQPSPERRPKDETPARKPSESKETSPVRKQSQPSPDRRPKEQTPVKKPTEPKESSPVRKQSQPSPDRRPSEKPASYKPNESPVRKQSQPSPDRRPADKSPVKKPEESPVRKRSQPSPDRAPVQKEPSPHRCSRSHERSPVPVEKPKTPSPTKASTDRTDFVRTTRTSKADILVNQKTEGKNMSVTEITIQPVIETKKSDKVLTKQTSDSKFERKTTNSRVVTNKSSSDFDVKRKAAYEKSETIVDRNARVTSKPRTPATSPDKRRPQDTSPTKTEKTKNHITVAKIKIEPVRKTVQSKIVVEDKSKTAKTSKTTRKFANETEPESDKDTGISDNEIDDETVTTTTTTTTITTTKKLANNQVTDRKDSAPVYRTTGKVEKNYTRSSSDNVLKTANATNVKKATTTKSTTATATTASATKKSVDRPVKCVTTKTINLSAKPMIDSDNLDNVVIDIQQAKSSREPTPNKLIPIPVSPDEDTGKPRYPDTVQEPDDEPKHVPKVSNIPILEETTNEYIGCEITEVEDHEVRAARASRITNLDRVTEDDESLLSVTQKVSKFVEEANRLKDLPTTKTPNRFVRHEYDELDEHLKSDECLLSVSDKVTKFISTAEEVKKIKTSGPFVPECKVTVDVAESDECLLSVNDKVSKFAKTTEVTTKQVTEEEERDIDEKKKKFISTAATAPQKSPELVKNVMKQTTRSEMQPQEDAESVGNEQKTSIVDRYTTATLTKPRDKVPQGVGLRSTEAVKKAKQIFETGNKPAASELARQKDILSRPSIWEDRRKKEQTTATATVEKTQVKTVQESQKDVKLMDIGVYKKAQPKQEPEPKMEEPKPDTTKRRDSGTPKTPAYIRDTVSTKKDMFEKRISSSKIDTSELVKSTTSQEDRTETTTATKRPSITEKYERTISRETPTPGGKPSYMNHTVSSLEHMNSSRRESVDNTQQRTVEEVVVQQESTVKTNKFGVELKRTDSGRNVITGSPTKRKSSVDSPVIEDIFDLETLEKMLESVNGYEQRRRIRSQIRLVKKAGEKVTTTTTTTTTMRTNSRVRDASPKRKEPSPTRAALRKQEEAKTVKTVEVEKKSEPVQRSASPTKSKPMTNGKTITSTTTVTTKTSRFGEKAPVKDVKDDGKPIWATSNILKKASETTRTFKTSSTTSAASKKTTPVMREVPKETKPTDCITSSYGVGPTDENGLPLFGIRALKKKAAPAPEVETKITGSIVTETLYSENGSAPVGERKTTVYSSDAKDLEELNISGSKRNLAEVREKLLERENSRKGLISLTKTEKIGNGSSHVTTEIGTLEDVPQREAKIVRKGSVKELTERFVHKESSSSLLSEKTYPKAGLILRSNQSHSSRSSTPCEISSIRSGSIDFDENDVELRSVAKSSTVRESVMTSSSFANQEEVEDGVVFRKSASSSSRQQQTRSFLNDGSRVSGVQDVLERMRNADNVEESGDSAEDREARALLNKFLGASVLMSGMESLIPGAAKEDTESSGTKKVSKVTTTRTVKSSTASSSGSAPKPSIENLEQIWDEAVLKQLLDSSTNYEERRRIRARLRQIMAEKEACADIVASVTADLQRERQQQQQQQTPQLQKQSSKDSSDTNANIQGESLLLPLLQGILLHKKGAGTSSSSSGGQKAGGSTSSQPVPPVEDSGTESGEDLRLLAAGLHDNMELYRGIGVGNNASANAGAGGSVAGSRPPPDGVDSLLHEVTAALLRLQLSLRDGKDMNLDTSKRNALLTLACRLQLGLMQPERLPEQVSPVEELVDGPEDKVDFNQARRGSARFAKRRNRNNRHTVGVSREELADARRFIEEIGRMENMSSHSHSATPEKSKTPEKSQIPYSLQKQQSLGTVLSNPPATPSTPAASTFAMKRPSQFIPNTQESNLKPALKPSETNPLAPPRDRKTKQKLFRQSQSFDAPSVTTNGHEPVAAQHKPIDVKPTNDPFKKPVQTAAQRALVKKYSFNDGSTSEEEEPHKTAEQVVLQKNTPKGSAVVNTVQKIVSREVKQEPQPATSRRVANTRSRTPDAQEAHLNGHADPSSKPLNKYTSKKLRMKRANTIDIPKKLLDNGVDSDDDSEDEHKQAKERPREAKAKTPVSSIIKPVVEVPDFKPKTENDKKFMAFLQKQNQTTKAMWSSNPVKEHVGANNWTSKFDHLKHNFEKADQSSRMVVPPKSAPKSSAMNFWKKAESASFDETAKFAKPPKPVAPVQNHAPSKPSQPKLPPKNVASVQQPPQIPDKPKPVPTQQVVQPVPKPKTPTSSQPNPTQFTHAPTSAFKPIPKKLPPVNLDFKPVQPEPEIVKPIPAHVSCGIVKQIVEAGFKETPDVKPEPIPVQLGLVKSLAAAGYHETPYVPPPKIERTPTHHVLNYQAKPAEPLEQSAPAAPWIGKKPADTSGNRVASIASTKFTANQFGMNKATLPAAQPLTYQGSLKYAEKPLSFQLPERIQAKRPSLPDVGEFKAQSRPDITYTFTDYTQPESVSTFTLNRSDSLTNPDNQPLVLTSTNSVYSPQQYGGGGAPQQINYLNVNDAMSSDSLSPSNVEDDDLESMDSQEMRVVTRVMKAPVSQQASYSNNKPSHLGSSSSERGSQIAQNLHSSLKLIKQKSPTPPKRMMPPVNQKRFSQDYGSGLDTSYQQPMQYNVPKVEVVPNTPVIAKPQPPQFNVPSHAIFNNVQRFPQSRPMYEPPRPAPLARTDSWVRLNQQPAVPNSLARAKSSHTLAVPPPYNGGYEPQQYQAVNDKQRTMEAYFSGQKPTFNALAKTASTHNILRDKTGMSQNNVRPVSYAMGHSYNPAQFNIMNSQHDYRQQQQQPMYATSMQQRVQPAPQQHTQQQQQYYQPPLGGGLSRSRTMPHIPMNNLSLLDEDNVEDAFEQLMNQSFAV